MRVCSIDGCGRPHSGHGLCQAHRQRQRIYSDPLAHIPVGEMPKVRCRTTFTPAPLLDLQTRRGWTNGQLADRVGVSIRTVSRWRANPHTRLTLDEADRYALALDRDIDDLWETT